VSAAITAALTWVAASKEFCHSAELSDAPGILRDGDGAALSAGLFATTGVTVHRTTYDAHSYMSDH
jgi:hypothetical protein